MSDFEALSDLLERSGIINVLDIGASYRTPTLDTRARQHFNLYLCDPFWDRQTDASSTEDYNSVEVLEKLAWKENRTSLPFYVTKKDECSSVFRPNHLELARYANSDRFEITEVIQAKAETLTSAFSDITHELIKIDAQGASAHIIQGSADTISKSVAVVTEVEFRPLYLGQKLADTVYRQLDSLNFVLVDVRNKRWLLNIHDATGDHFLEAQKHGATVFADWLWLKHPDELACTDDQACIKAAAIAAFYGMFDWALNYLSKANSAEELTKALLNGIRKQSDKYAGHWGRGSEPDFHLP